MRPESEGTMDFVMAQNYHPDRRFTVRRPMKRSFMDSVKEALMGKQG